MSTSWTASARTVCARSKTATRRRWWPKSAATTTPAPRLRASRTPGRPPEADAWRSSTRPVACISVTRLETVLRESPVRRARSARLAIPRSDNELMSERRLRSRSEASDPVASPSIPRDPLPFAQLCQESARAASSLRNLCAHFGLTLQKEGRRDGRPSRTADVGRRLLDLDGAAGLLELRLELVGLFLLDALLDGLRGLVDKRLGLLEAKAGGRADDLDDLDLLVARGGQDDVEGGLLLLAAAVSGSCAAGGRSRGRDGRRRHAELLLERLDALAELEHRDALELLDPICSGGCHVGVSLRLGGAVVVLCALGGLVSGFGGVLGGRLCLGLRLGGRRLCLGRGSLCLGGRCLCLGGRCLCLGGGCLGRSRSVACRYLAGLLLGL